MSEQLDVDTVVQQKFDQIVAYAGAAGTKIDSQTFTLFPNYVETKIGALKKSISLLDFKNIIDSLLSVESKLIHTAMPFNCYTFARSTTEIKLGCYHPERIATVKYINRNTGKEESYTIPIPNIIVGYSLKVTNGIWAVSDVRYFCTNKKVTQLPEDKVLMEKDTNNGIFAMPFPNFYESNTMCYGRNTMPSKYTNNLRGLDYYYQVIFESAFNDDLGVRGVRNSGGVSAWFKELATLKAFPYDRLVGFVR